ncbi:MAG: 4Fe-4S binding protein [Rhodocyclaceae bacterium]
MNAPETGPVSTDPYLALAGARGLALWPAACLALRAGEKACRRCARICPTNALGVADSGPRIAGECLGCGRCAASCPTGALRAEGYDTPPRLPDGNQPVKLDCWKLPRGLGGDATTRVPCLYGLSVTRLVELAAAAHGRGVVVLDHGWCGGCEAGRGAASQLSRAIDEANALLAACAFPPSAQIRVRVEPLPEAMRADAIPTPSAEVPHSRRAFFRRLRVEISRIGKAPSAPDRVSLRAGAFPLPARRRLIEVARALAGGSLTLPLPAATVAQECANHGVCAAACPTGALRGYEDRDVQGLVFDPAACVACGLCERCCPEQALRIEAPLAIPLPASPVRLTRFVQRTCTSCGEPFATAGGACPSCTTRQRLARDLFGPVIARQ